MLHRADERLFFAADQVIARISPNVSVHAMEPDLDALGIYLRSLSGLRDAVAEDVLVLPGHGLPFYGLHQRIAELIEHHAQRCVADRRRMPAAAALGGATRAACLSSASSTSIRPVSRSARCWRT